MKTRLAQTLLILFVGLIGVLSVNAQFESNKFYRLTSEFVGKDKSLDVTNNAANQIQLGDSGDYSGQHWRIEKLNNGYYRLTTKFRGTDMSLDVINDGEKNKLNLSKTGDFSGQYWKIQNLGNGFYRLTNAFRGDGMSLDVVNDGQKRSVQLAPTGDYSGQRWMISEVSSGGEIQENPMPVIGYKGPTTKKEMTVSLPFASTQKLTVEVTGDGMVIFQKDIVLGNISDFAGNNPRSSDVNFRVQSNSILPYIVKAGYGKSAFVPAGIKIGDFNRSKLPSSGTASSIWTNSTIPYVIQAGHRKRKEILAGINEINSKTNLRLVERTTETDYAEFVSQDGKGFWAVIGKAGGRQIICIDQTADYVPVSLVAHEILHTAGFYHTQSREDRDNYVIINFDNIQQDLKSQFERIMDKSTNIGPYDYTSVMHYAFNLFSKNGKNTIDRKDGGDNSKLGSRHNDLSPSDIAMVANRYAPPSGKSLDNKTIATKPTPPPPPTPAAKPTQSVKTPPTTTGTSKEMNIAIGKKVYIGNEDNRSSNDNRANDGNTDGRYDMGSVVNAPPRKYNYWEIDLGAVYDVSRIVVWNRTDACCWAYLQNFVVSTSAEEIGIRVRDGASPMPTSTDENGRGIDNIGPFSPWTANKTDYTVPINRKTRWIRITVSSKDPNLLNAFSLAEVQIFGTLVK